MENINEPQAPAVEAPQDVAAAPQEQADGVHVYDISGKEPVLGMVPHDQVTEAVASGQYTLPQGQVQVINPDGELGEIDAKEAPAAFQAGFKYATPADINAIKYGTAGQQAITALEGAAKGLAGPLAPAAERALGVNPEDIRGRAEANPWTHGISEVAGLVAPAVLTGGASAEARAAAEGAGAAAEAPSMLAKAAEFTQGPLIEKAGQAITGALGLPEAVTPLAKIGSAAAKGAVDNAIYRVGNELGSAVLQQPDQDIGYAAADVGLAGLIGAAFGAGMGSVSPLWEAAMGSKTGSLLKVITDKQGGIENIVPNAVTDALETTGLGSKIAPEVKSAMSDIPELREYASVLRQRDTGAKGPAFQEAEKAARQSIDDMVVKSFGIEPEELASKAKISRYETGKNIAEILSSEVEKEMAPIREAYEGNASKYGQFELPKAEPTLGPDGSVIQKPALVDKISEDISNLAQREGWSKSPSSVEMNLVNRTLEELPLQTEVKDISKYIKTLNGKVNADPLNSTLRQAVGKINGILRAAEGAAVEAHLGASEGEEALNAFKAARKAFAKQAELTDVLDSRLHIKGSSTSGYAGAIKDYAADKGEAFLNKIFSSKDASFLSFIQENYPQTAQAIREHVVQDLIQGATEKGALNTGKLLKSIDKLSPEAKNFAIPSDALQKTQAAGTLLDALKDPTHNFSNTARTWDKLSEKMTGSVLGLATMLMGHNPITAMLAGKLGDVLGRDAPDAAKLALLKYLGSNQEASSKGFKAMFDAINTTMKGESMAAKAAKNLFKAGAEVVPGHVLPKPEHREKLDKQLDKLQKEPNKALDIGGHTAYYLPEHGAALTGTAARAMGYLNSLKPQTAPAYPFDGKRIPNEVEKARYNSALDIANSPLLVMHKIKNATVTPNDVQDLKAMYPGLYTSLSTKITHAMLEHAGKDGSVPYKTRLGLSVFLGQPLDSTMTPQSIMAAQPVPKQPETPQGAPKGPHSTKNLPKLAQQAMTPDQARQAKSVNKA